MAAPSAMLPGLEAMQMQPTPPRKRAQRQTSSCLECRRRKQKVSSIFICCCRLFITCCCNETTIACVTLTRDCSQGQPCTNCYRRFPTPECVYEVKSSKRLDHIICFPFTASIFCVCVPQFVMLTQYISRAPPPSPQPKLPSIAEVRGGPYSHLNPASIQHALYYMADQLPDSSPSSSSLPSPTGSSCTTLSTQSTTSIWNPYPTAASPDGDTDKTIAQSIEIIKKKGTEGVKRILSNDMIKTEDDGNAGLGYPIAGSMTQLNFLPMKATKLNKELVRLHGQPDPANEFMNMWVPCTVQDPLLLQIVLFTSACFLTETGDMPKKLRYIYQGHVYMMLNKQLGDANAQKNDTLLLAVVQMISDAWYWGETTHLQTHLQGLKVMVRMRGGLGQLGLRGYLAKMILV
ncbi:unnamed protein product [Fusarium equiseti]|uniref:Uncharacterized protein n=1 Tax=Fusarium equiseti TaxID=61235 RepID=A0A8J2IVI3_FUSEQ|nr:unnamed protein product [Fusarium equiseti]